MNSKKNYKRLIAALGLMVVGMSLDYHWEEQEKQLQEKRHNETQTIEEERFHEEKEKADKRQSAIIRKFKGGSSKTWWHKTQRIAF